MDFEITTRSEGELCGKLSLVKLRKGTIQPYLNAHISIETMHPSILAPTQRYVLSKELKKIEQLRWDIMHEYGHDMLGLSGYLKCFYPDESIKHDGPERYGDTIDILPPIVEEWFSNTGRLFLIVADGLHRIFLARQMETLVNVAYVRGVNRSYGYYAHPLPGGWNDVQIIDRLEEGYIKKFHTVKDHRARFRDYNTEFENIGDSRPYEAKG